MASQFSQNLQTTFTEKQRKYKDLVFEISQQLQPNKIIAILLVFSATRVNHNMPNHSQDPQFTAHRTVRRPTGDCTIHLFRCHKIPQ
jgi:hypothetical protein